MGGWLSDNEIRNGRLGKGGRLYLELWMDLDSINYLFPITIGA